LIAARNRVPLAAGALAGILHSHWPTGKKVTEVFNIAQILPATSLFFGGISEVRAMIDQSARTLLYILRSTQYLAWHYRESGDGPKMSRTIFTLQRSGEEPMAAAHLDRAASP
jgi:hypothetical protein